MVPAGVLELGVSARKRLQRWAPGASKGGLLGALLDYLGLPLFFCSFRRLLLLLLLALVPLASIAHIVLLAGRFDATEALSEIGGADSPEGRHPPLRYSKYSRPADH